MGMSEKGGIPLKNDSNKEHNDKTLGFGIPYFQTKPPIHTYTILYIRTGMAQNRILIKYPNDGWLNMVTLW